MKNSVSTPPSFLLFPYSDGINYVINQVWPRVVLDYLSMHGASNNYRNVENMIKLLTKMGSDNHVTLVEVTHQWHWPRLNTTFSYKPKHSTTELLGSQKGMIRSSTGGNMLYIVYQNTVTRKHK